MQKHKIILTRKWPEECEQRAQEWFDAQLNEDDRRLSVAELKQAIFDFDAVCPTVSDFLIDGDALGSSDRKCKILGNFGVGFNNIDTQSAKSAGVVVTNTPDVLTDCTADIAMTLMLMVARRAAEGERHVRDMSWSGWRPTHMLGTKVSGKKLGLVGFGRIAKAVADRAHFGFGMQIYFYDPYFSDPTVAKNYDAIQCESLDEVVQLADFVSLHCPGGGDNVGLINADVMSLMQSSAFLINTSRGDVVDEQALIEALQNKTIAGAALDVFEKEPAVSNALLPMDNVVLLPHLGSATRDTRVAMGMCVLDNIKAFFDGDTIPNRVI